MSSAHPPARSQLDAKRPASALSPRPWRFSVSREGVFWLLLAFALVGVGLYKGINLLMLLACLMVGLWLLNAWLAGRRLRRLQAKRVLPDLVFAGEPFRVGVQLTNRAGKAQQGVRLEDKGPLHALAWFVARLGPREGIRLRQEMSLPRRGRYALDRLLACSGFPFGLAHRRAAVGEPEEIIVLPRLGRVSRTRLRRYLARTGLHTGRNLQHARRHPTAQHEFHGLRAFRSGDSPRWIHWRTTARCGELMVREFEDVPTDNLVLVVDPWLPAKKDEGRRMKDEKDNATPSSFILHPSSLVDEIVTLAATVCWEWCRQAGDRLALAIAGSEPVVVDGVTGPEHARRLLEALAVQEGNSAAERSAVVGQLAALALPEAPLLVLTTGSDQLAEALRERFGRPVACLDVSNPNALDFYERPADHAP